MLHLAFHSLWRDTLLSLDIVGKVLAPPPSDMPDFVDLLSLRNGWECSGGKVEEEEKEWELRLV